MTADEGRRSSPAGIDYESITSRMSECVSCGSHLATAWSTPEGTAWLCRECATLHVLGCP